MKKATKRLMMVVAILLCLVLISTSVVSGVFARFVIEKNATTTVTLNQFGVTVEFTGIGSNPTKTGDSITYTSTLSMKPGDSKTITAKISGKPTVSSTITVDTKIEYEDSAFTITGNQDFTDIKEDTVYFPIGFKVGNTSVVAPYSNKSAATISSDIENQIQTVLTGFTWSTASGVSTATWGTSTPNYTTAKDISLNFYWPKNHNGSDTAAIYDEIGTYLSKGGAKTFKVTYTISVTQK